MLSERLIWKITVSGQNFGPYDSFAKAYYAARTNFGDSGWFITADCIECEED